MGEEPYSETLENYREFCAAVGRLIIKWAELETTMSSALRLHLEARLKRPKSTPKGAALALSAAIYGSMRLKASRDIARRILEQERASAALMAFRKALFEQAAHIEDLRDKLCHQSHWSTEEIGVWRLADFATTKTIGDLKTYEVNVLSIMKAAADLGQISHSVDVLFPTRKPRTPPAYELPAWQYKSSMLKLLPRKDRLSYRSPVHPRETSRE